MKEVHIRRHAPKYSTGILTEDGKALTSALKQRLGQFDLVISSSKPRAVETAMLLSGVIPITDSRASAIEFTPEQEKELHEQGQHHPFGIAGVIFDTPEYRPRIIKRGEDLVALIKESFSKLQKNGRALIISHDGVMVAAEMLLKKLPLEKAQMTYQPLQGFKVYEDWKLETLE